MGFRQSDSEGRGGFARVWSVEDKGNYSVCKVSTSKKRKDGSGYDTDFQDGFVRFIGSAHEKISSMTIGEKGVPIQITACEVTTPFNPETKKGYTNYAIFAFDEVESNNSGAAKKSTAKASKKAKTEEPVDDTEDELPF